MHPVLFKLGRFEIHSYGLMLALSFLVGIYWAMSRSEKRGIHRNHIMDLSIIVIIAAIVGARIMYVVTHLAEFEGRWLDTINPIQSTGEIGIPGLTLLGGVLLSLVSIIIFCSIRHIPVLKLFDVAAPGFAFGIFLTRIGCFLAGCCYGLPCHLPWAMTFPMNSPAGSRFLGVAIHPTQLYSSLYGLIILITVLLLDRKPKFDGFLAAVFFMLYGISRFLVDMVRFYESVDQIYLWGIQLTFNQIISLSMFLFGLALMIILHLRNRRSTENS